LAAFACMLGEVHADRDASHIHVGAIQQDFFTQARDPSSRYKQPTDLGRMLEEW
jgi:hypothetical protein